MSRHWSDPPFIFMLALAVVLALHTRAGAAAVCEVTRLRVDAQENPLGVDPAAPTLAWQLVDSRRGARQTAYRILVASTPERLREGRGDLWDSGKVMSGQSAGVAYGGPTRPSESRCWWTVRVWDRDGKPSPWTAPGRWEVGLRKPSDWQAQWIGLQDTTDAAAARAAGPSPLLRKRFVLTKPIRTARVYVTAKGSYRLLLNGRRVGRDILTPDWTDYRKRIPYQIYDVTDLLKPGENAVGAMLGDGWYASGLGWNLQRFCFGPPPVQLLMKLRVEYRDGTTETIVSDGSWKGAPGPIQRSEIYAGETYDALKEQPGWDAPGFDDRAGSTWKTVNAVAPVDATGPELDAQSSPTIQVTATLKPKTIAEPAPGVYVVDMGQNMVGWVRLRVRGKAGDRVRLRFAEILQLDGKIYTQNLRRAEATDTYTLRGGGEETFEPHFTYHGFRYVELTGYPGKPDASTITGLVFHTKAPESGRFYCSDEMVNRLWNNINWGQRGNMESVPTDCPQRDERLGWMGDAEIFWPTACYNRDMQAFSHKWMRDVIDAQSPQGGFSDVSPRIVDPADGAPAWGDAGIIVPYVTYRQYGDTRIVQECYPAMQKWVDYIRSANPDLLWRKRRNNDFGDWVPANSNTDKGVIATAFFAQDAKLMAEMARALGKTDDAKAYANLYAGIRAAFNRAYVHDDGTIGNGSQTCYALALHMRLLDEAQRRTAVRLLVEDIEKRGGHLSTGFIGTSYLMSALSENGRDDVAYRLLLNDTFPSWGYMIKKGATTMWERWNGDTGDPGMNSFNHYAFGAVGEWLYRFAGGIEADPGAPGFHKIVIHPRLDSSLESAPGDHGIIARPSPEMPSASAEYDSVYGKIVSDWARTSVGLTLNVTIPPNTTATIYVPTTDANSVTEGGRPIPAGSNTDIRYLRAEDGCAVYAVGAGTYQFASR